MCNHNNQIGDNYGLSCADCGEQLRGYGYGGFFGANLLPGTSCKHQFLDTGDGYEACLYCEEVRSADWQAAAEAEHADWLDEQRTLREASA